MATNQGFKSLVPNPALLDARYLARWLRASKGYLQALGTGATFKEVSKAVVARVEIPIPPLDEQRRVAAILDQADVLRSMRGQTLELLATVTQATFLSMFGNPDDVTDTVRFGQVAGLAGGRNLVADDPDVRSKFRVLKISAVTTGHFRPSESKPLPPAYVPPVAHLVRSGDLLMSRANTAELVGAVAHVGVMPHNLVLPDKIWRFEWRDERSVPIFYQALFSTPAIRRRVSQMASGTGGSMKNVSKAKLELLELPRIEVDQQREFAARVERIHAQRALAQRSLASLDELFASLQASAFSGAL